MKFTEFAKPEKIPTGTAVISDPAIIADDIFRSSIIMAVASFDEYFTDKFAELLLPYIKSKRPKPNGFYDLLHEAGINTKEALSLLTMHRPNKRIKNLVRKYLEKYTTQSLHQIDKLFLAYGIKNFSQNVAQMSRRKRILSQIRLLVKRQHEIVHEGGL